MCGHDWCSVRISKEIQEFASGKTAKTLGTIQGSAALNDEQRKYRNSEVFFLQKRSIVGRQEKGRVQGQRRRRPATLIMFEETRKIQFAPGETLVELRTEEAHNLPNTIR